VVGNSEQAPIAESYVKKSRIEKDASHDYFAFKMKCEKLRHLLWKKKKKLRDVIFTSEKVKVPTFCIDDTFTEELTHTKLSLDGVVQKYLVDNPREDPSKWKQLLPCGSNELLFREAYREMMHCIFEYEKENGYMWQRSNDNDGCNTKPSNRDKSHKGFIITGHPGIGKTWFLSAVLVGRLLLGGKTVLQVGFKGDYRHLLFDHIGVRYLDELAGYDDVFQDVKVWALVDQQPKRRLEDHRLQEWLVVVISCLRYENYKQLDKECSPHKYIMPPWTWPEIVSAW
jgi:hypothetical protein